MYSYGRISESFPIKGELEIRVWDAKRFPTHESIKRARCLGLKPLEIRNLRNLIVTAGKNYVCDLMIGAQSTVFQYCGVGSGTNAPAAGDTDLQTTISPRVAVTDKFRTNNIVKFDTFFNSSANPGTWNESGTFTALTGGTMLSRALISPAITKDSTKTVTISWQITVGS